MNLRFEKRKADRKSDSLRLRRDGKIPAVVYHNSKTAETIAIPAEEFSALLRTVLPGRLPTTIFTLEDGRRVVCKDIQYNPVNYQVIHLDFEELVDGISVNVKVPIEIVGGAESPGVKLGGVVRQVIRHIRVNCAPKDIPQYFEINVSDLNMRGTKRLKDLALPNTLRPLANMNEVAVVIVKR